MRVKTATGPLPETRLQADLIKFSLAVRAVEELSVESGVDVSALMGDAEALLRRFKEEFLETEKSILSLLEGQAFDGLKSKPRLVAYLSRLVGTPQVTIKRVVAVSRVYKSVFGWFKTRQPLLKSAFTDKPTQVALIGVSNACLDVMVDLNGLLLVERASKAQSIGKWIADACALLEQANPVEQSLRDIREVAKLAGEIKSLDARIRAGGLPEGEQIKMLQNREVLYDKLLDMTKGSEDRQALLAEAGRVINTNTSFQTRTGEIQRLTPEQEEAMMVTGKSIIAAGAGSGKTRVLASKIAYTINELGASPDQIIATTFGKEASNELKSRASKYSNGASDSGRFIGSTTHSISHKICTDSGFLRGVELMSESKAEAWMKAAIEQVMLYHPASNTPPLVRPFINLALAAAPLQSMSVQVDQAAGNTQQVDELKRLLIETARVIGEKAIWAINNNMSWGRGDLDKIRPSIQNIDNRGNITFLPPSSPIWDDRGFRDTVNALITTNRGQNSIQKAGPFPGFTGKFASFPPFGKPEPVGQWFNIGYEREDVLSKDQKVSDYMKEIGIYMADMVSPTELWSGGNGGAVAAVYGAYMYFKTREKLADYDDLLVWANKSLVENPSKLRSMQAAYKYIFVDEAQDLNKAQHTLFGLIAGHINPETLQPYGDGRMTADTYCFIGDDKQAIYEFRGAQPEEFINISDAYNGEFKTSVLRTNFRSGRNIVQAANKLIAHNTKQIPMVCNPTPTKEEGRITSEDHINTSTPQSPGAVEVAKEISEIIEIEGWSHQNGEQHKFGIGCRTNAELTGYAFELLVAGVPYFCKRDLMNTATMLAPVHLMSVRSNNPVYKLEAVKMAHKHLLFYIDSQFNASLDEQARHAGQHPLDFLVNGGWRSLYPSSQTKRLSNAKAYADALKSIMDFEGTNSELIDFVCRNIRGLDGKNLLERTGENLSAAEIDDLSRETESGEVTLDDMAQYAESGTRVVHRVFEKRTLEDGLTFFFELKKQSKTMADKSNEEGGRNKNSVFLGTMHAWKGLECRDMYLPMTNGYFPDPRSDIESERRLAYVAITRGQDRVKILYGPDRNPSDRGNKGKGGPSPFISEACIQPEISLDTRTASVSFMEAMREFLRSN